MKNFIPLLIITCIIIVCLSIPSYADSKKTWANIGKGLAIYEGFKVLTGREGNIVDDVTRGMRPRQGYSESSTSYRDSYDKGYNEGYSKGYDAGYNAGFRSGVGQTNR